MPTLQHLAWAFAFALALRGFDTHARHGHLRFALGLWLGVVFAHLGWALLHWPAVVREPRWLLAPGGVSVLFFPLGVLAVAPWRESLAALPRALLVARLGCLPYACCYASPWQALPELAAWAGLHLAVRARPREAALLVLAGFGLVRLLSEPLRVPASGLAFGTHWVALAWVAAGVALRRRLGSADAASDWSGPRTRELLRALLLTATVWALFPLAARVLADPGRAFPAACAAAALAAVLGTRGTLPRGSLRAGPAFAVGLVAGFAAVSALATLAAPLAGHVAAAAGLWPLGGSLHRGAVPLATRPAWCLSVLVLAPLFEELLYRGRLLAALRALAGSPAAVLLSSLLFAASHVRLEAMPAPFALGLASGALVLRTRSLPLAIGLHAGANAAALLAAR